MLTSQSVSQRRHDLCMSIMKRIPPTSNEPLIQANLIYLAIITDRVPIIPPFVPSHIGGDAGSIAFGDIFNTTRLGKSIGIPVVEWKDVKKSGSSVVDELGCWDIWQATQYDEHFPRRSGMLSQLNLGR